MARKISRANGASWGTGKGLWGTIDHASWLPAKKAWANNAGVWTQVWPPDMAFTSFAVTATTAEPGYGSSLISWAIDTSVPGTVSIQRKTPAGVWSDVYTGQPISGSQTLNPLIPTQGAAGTWQFRAVFIPTHDPAWLVYSALDNVTVTVPAATLTVTATSGEVYFTNSTMTWSVTGTTPGTVRLQRKLGAGAWADFATGLAKSGSSSYQLAPAGAANSGTWYYRAVFEPTHDATWDILSAEDSATLTYRSKAALPNLGIDNLERENDGDPSWCWGAYITDTPRFILSGAITDSAIVSSISVQITSLSRYYAWVGPNASLAYTDTNGGRGGYSYTYAYDGFEFYKLTGTGTWADRIHDPYYLVGRSLPGSPTAGYGYMFPNSLQFIVTYVDGSTQSVSRSNSYVLGTGVIQ